MSCDGIAHPYVELATGLHKWTGTLSPGVLCTSLFVSSNLIDVPIEVSPPDDDGAGDGLTGFCRQYSETAPVVVTLAAPEFFGDEPELPFTRWYVDGVAQPDGELVVQITIDGSECHEARAHYGGVSTAAVCNGVIDIPQVAQVSAQYSASFTPGANCTNNPIEHPCGCRRSWRNCSNAIWAAQRGTCAARIVEEGTPIWRKTVIQCDCEPGEPCPCQMPCPPTCTVNVRTSCFGQGCSWPWNEVMAPSGYHCGVEIRSCVCDTVADIVRVVIAARFQAAACRFLDLHIYECVLCTTGDPNFPDCCPSPWCAAPGKTITVERMLSMEAPFDGTQQDCDDVVQSMFNPGATWESEQWVDGSGSENSFIIAAKKQITVRF